MAVRLATLPLCFRSVMFRKLGSWPKQSHECRVARFDGFQPFVAIGENLNLAQRGVADEHLRSDFWNKSAYLTHHSITNDVD
jgi:hypothetical protein